MTQIYANLGPDHRISGRAPDAVSPTEYHCSSDVEHLCT